ncbi:FH protein interacting protein FIP2-like isoform X1 [Vicia villosa]|uniref:FH protein interacting protein FIP2-like isoform X1 n=2 Tax=Vicia villosa TaxID=3911 RepID=UPI00273CF382|nr:FH protein interacting protein FIP2-like isoform X1 [Vicia villosa]
MKDDFQSDTSSVLRLNIGGKKFSTTIDTMTHREPESMLAAMFSGRHTLPQDPHKGYVFVDRDGTHFRHILNWLRDGVVPTLEEAEYAELLREAEYYQLLGLVDGIQDVLNKRKEDDELRTELTRTDIIKCIQSDKVRFRGVNLSGIDLSKLDLSFVDFSYACLKNVFFSRVNLQCAKFRDVDAEGSIFHNANLRECEFTGANLRGALLAGACLQSANLQDACLVDCSFCEADLRSAHLQVHRSIFFTFGNKGYSFIISFLSFSVEVRSGMRRLASLLHFPITSVNIWSDNKSLFHLGIVSQLQESHDMIKSYHKLIY